MLLPKVSCYTKRLCPLLFGLSLSLNVHAQEPIDISGTVIDNYGVKVQNAEVRIRGTDISSNTNARGEFHLSGVLVPPQGFAGAFLDVSKEGYFPERRELTSGSGTLDPITIRDDIIIPKPQSVFFPGPPVPLPKRAVSAWKR